MATVNMFNMVMLTTFLFFVSAHSTAPCEGATCQEESDSSALLQGRIKAEKAIDTETVPKMAQGTDKHSRSKVMSDDTLDELEKMLKQAADLDNDTNASKALDDMKKDENNGTDPGELVVGNGSDHDAAMRAIDEVSQLVSPEDELNETGSVPTAHMLQELNNQSQEVETKDAHADGIVEGDMGTGGNESQAALLLQLSAQGKRFVSNLWEDKMNIKYCFAWNCSESSRHAVKLAVQHYLNHIPCLGFQEVSVGDDATKKCSEEPGIYIQSDNDGCWANVGQPWSHFESDPNCKDSTDYADPQFGDKCTGWVGYKCTGYSFTAALEAACPSACKKCPGAKKYGKSVMNLETHGCDSLGTAAHELGHNLGMLHEQSRSDAHKYVTIIWENINPNEISQYATSSSADTTVEYNAMSLMHYGDDYFNVGGGKKTMRFTGSSNVVMGNRMGLTYSDVLQTAKMYGCEDSIQHFKLCTEKADGCTKEACSCGPSTKLIKIQDGDCFRCMKQCPLLPSGDSVPCGCPAGFSKSCFTQGSIQYCGCWDDSFCSEKSDGCSKEACSCKDSTKIKTKDGSCFRCLKKCPDAPQGNSGACSCPTGHSKGSFMSGGTRYYQCLDDSCVDSTDYKDPTYGETCAQWVGYRCTGYGFSDNLIKNCPKACKKCNR